MFRSWLGQILRRLGMDMRRDRNRLRRKSAAPDVAQVDHARSRPSSGELPRQIASELSVVFPLEDPRGSGRISVTSNDLPVERSRGWRNSTHRRRADLRELDGCVRVTGTGLTRAPFALRAEPEVLDRALGGKGLGVRRQESKCSDRPSRWLARSEGDAGGRRSARGRRRRRLRTRCRSATSSTTRPSMAAN